MDAAIQWLLSNTGICKHDLVTIETSTICGDAGGYGIFIDLSDAKGLDSDDNKLELLRIPRAAAISTNTVRSILTDTKNEDVTYLKLKSHLKEFLSDESHHEYINETNLLIVFLILKAILSDETVVDSTDFISYYLHRVLLQTVVPLPVNKFQDDARNWSQYYKEYMNFPQQLFIEALNRFFAISFPESDYSNLITTIYCSVISRILEIPEAANSEDTTGNDFYVTPTLVPLLDFANHDNDRKNAFFDVDRKTNDIVLYLDVTKVLNMNEKSQVFISYSPLEELVNFEQIYGFLPKSNSPQVWCYRLEDEFLSKVKYKDLNLSHFYRQMRVRPSFQLIITPESILINDCIIEFGEVLLPFLQHMKVCDKPCFKLANDGRTYLTYVKDADNNIAETSLPKEQCLEEYFGENQEDDLYEKTSKEFLDFLQMYIQYRLDKLKYVVPISSASSFTEFWKRETSLLQALQKQFAGNEPVMWYEKYGSVEVVVPQANFPPPCQIDYENMITFLGN